MVERGSRGLQTRLTLSPLFLYNILILTWNVEISESLENPLTIAQVVEAFPSRINDWCFQQHKIQDIPKYKMCLVAKDVFSDYYSSDFITKQIDSKFKINYRVNNGRKSWTKRASERIVHVEAVMKTNLVEGTHHARK